MKRTWNIVSFVAIVNLLTILMIILWMWQTDRLNEDRLNALRTWIISPPTVDGSVEEQLEGGQFVNERDPMLGLSSQQRLEWLEHWKMQSEQRLQSLVDEAERRSLEVQSRLTDLELQRTQLAARERALEELTEAQKAADAVVEEAEASRNADAKLKAAGVPAGETEIPRARLLERLEERRVRRRRSGPDRGRGGSARA